MGSVGAAVAGGLATGGAGALMSSMLGGDSGYKKKTSSPYTRAQRSLLADVVERTRGSMDEGFPTYDEDVIPGPTPGQEAAGEFATGTLEEQLPALRERGMQLLEPEEWDPSQAHQRWQKTVMDPAREQFQEEMAPAIMEEFGSRNALDSSAVGEALGEAGEDVMTSSMRKLADLEFRDYRQHKGRQLQRAKIGQSMLGSALERAGMAGDMTAPLREIEQQQAMEEKQQWAAEQPWNNPWLQNYMGQIMGVQPKSNAFVSQPPSKATQLGNTLMSQGAKMGARGLADYAFSGGGGGGTSGVTGMFSGGSPTPGTSGYNPPAL